MKVQHRSLFVVLLACLLLMAACGGGADTGGADTGGATGGSDTAGGAQSAETRMKEDAALGPAPQVIAPGAAGPAARGATGPTSDVAGVCLSPVEGELARMVNEYRVSLGLPALQISKSLSLVAQQHAWDSVNNRNAWPTAPAGKECNLHTWSGVVNPALQQGTWTEVCYTSDHANAEGMWKKPAEIAGFPGEGVENSFWSSGTATASGALTAWKNSPGHNNVITQQGGWGPMAAIGVGVNGGVAHLWLSSTADPAGEALLCGGGSAMEQPTAVPPTAVPTAVPPTATAVPPTAVPTEPAATTAPDATAAPTVAPTAVPPTAVPPTAVPPTAAAPTGEVLNQAGQIASGGGSEHTFPVAPGRTYTVVVSPSAEFDVDPSYECQSGNSTASGGFDWSWEGEAETFTYTSSGDGSCRVIINGYQGSAGSYTITVNAR